MRHDYSDGYRMLMATIIDISGFEHRKDEFDDLVDLLLTHVSEPSLETERLAYAVAFACLGRNHLWQDLRLENRTALSELLGTHFAPLARQNTRDMKWKKFFYKKLCELEGFNACRSPSCDECVDYTICFGPEE